MMVHVLNLILWLSAAVLLVPTAVFCIECVAACLPRRRPAYETQAARPRVAVIMPAHDEEFGIDAALKTVMPQLSADDRIVVIADNCSDGTATVARAAGALVVERNDPDRRGKGFALDCGMQFLASDPPEVVIFIDSDCVLHPGSISALSWQVRGTGRAAQAVYLLSRPANAHPSSAVSSLAFLVKNLVRPRGLHRLYQPCLLTGSGMALPWAHAQSASLASGNIVEDLQLGIDLTLAGHSPLLCNAAFVTGELPSQRQAAVGQRRRWEHGYVQTAIRNVPKLLASGLRNGRLATISIALELSVPPLALLVFALLMATIATSILAFAGLSHRVPVVVGGGLVGVIACVIVSWFRFGRDRVPAGALLGTPSYLLGKLPLYAGFAFQRETQWIRTARGDGAAAENSVTADGAPTLPTIVLQGVQFHSVTEEGCVDYVIDELRARRGGVLVTPNLDHLRRCRHDPNFAAMVSQSQVVVADGMPLVWASRLQRTPLPQRVAGSDLISSISAAAAKTDHSVYLLGGSPGAAESAAAVLAERHPNLKVCGTHCPSMGFEHNPEALSEIIDRLTAVKPDIIYVGLGSPKQERLIHELREWLPQSWWLGVGYSFSFLAGDGERAPVWMQKVGLEWLHRLLKEPRRLAKRYLVDGLPHAARLFAATAYNGLSRRPLVAHKPEAEHTVKTIQQHRTLERADNGKLDEMISATFARGLGVDVSRLGGNMSSSHGPMRKLKADGRLRAMVLLGGTLRPTPFIAAINRSILDMPIQDGRRLLANWQHQASELAKFEAIDSLPVRVLVDHDSPMPAAVLGDGPCAVSIERDSGRYRGTGGLLRDLAEEYEDRDYLLVGNGAQMLTQPLVDLVRQLHETEADISFIAHQDGTPSSMMLIRCAALREINASGYIDLKEQALPAIARNFKVIPVDQARATCMSLRTHRDYLAALRWWHFQRSVHATGDVRSSAPLWAAGASRFSIVEHGAQVDPSACLQDCVILRGARVGAGVVVVRSVVCAGSVLSEGDTAVDQLVSTRFPVAIARGQRGLQLSRN